MNELTTHYIGHLVDIEQREVYPGEIIVQDGKIQAIHRLEEVAADAPYYLPGLTDSHIHIESSMMVPQEFARLAVTHGTVNAVCDPHEITNVLGVEGINFMTENAKNSRFHFYFGLPSCVPSSELESAGAEITAAMTEELIQRDDLYFLGEMMNFPGVLCNDPEVMGKIRATQQAGKPIDGHAPKVCGEDLKKYMEAGITTDHECENIAEAREKIQQGMLVQIREGSAARNFEALYRLIGESPDRIMLCSDDRHPDDLLNRHIDELIRRGMSKGLSIWDLLQVACITPLKHYPFLHGLMKEGDSATFIAVNNLEDFRIEATYLDGYCVYDRLSGTHTDVLTIGHGEIKTPNNFKASPITLDDIKVNFTSDKVKVIDVFDGELFTACRIEPITELRPPRIQKMMVYNRYGHGRPQVAYVKGFDFQQGAIGASIAHDSHNLIVVGASDEAIVRMANALIEARGGVGIVNGTDVHLLPLPIAGLMSDRPAEEIAEQYHQLCEEVKELGTHMQAAFLTMSFLALPVIPTLKLTDKGLVDFRTFDFTSMMVEDE